MQLSWHILGICHRQLIRIHWLTTRNCAVVQAYLRTGLRERESQPYHMQPAAPERFRLDRRPSPIATTVPQYDDAADFEEEPRTAEQLAHEALKEAERLREW